MRLGSNLQVEVAVLPIEFRTSDTEQPRTASGASAGHAITTRGSEYKKAVETCAGDVTKILFSPVSGRGVVRLHLGD